MKKLKQNTNPRTRSKTPARISAQKLERTHVDTHTKTPTHKRTQILKST